MHLIDNRISKRDLQRRIILPVELVLDNNALRNGIGIVLYIFISVVLMFTIPNEIKNMYERDGRESPVSAIWGLWFLLPLIGHIIWYLKVQNALNDFWQSKGALAA